MNQNSSIQYVFNLIILKRVKGDRIEEALSSVNVIKLCPLKPFLPVMSFQFSIPRRLFSEGHLEFVGIVVRGNNNIFGSPVSRDLSSVFLGGSKFCSQL